MKRIGSWFMLWLCTLACMGEVYSGTCGTTMQWSLDTEKGLLSITGSGSMTEFDEGEQPWYPYRDYIRACEIAPTVTYVASNAFYKCTNLCQLSYPIMVENDMSDMVCYDKNLPTVETLDVSGVGQNEGTMHATITADGNLTVTDYGICYGTSNSTLTNCVSCGKDQLGAYLLSLTDLGDNTTYYYKAYATNSMGTAYGEVKSFKTESGLEGMECGHKWVRLWKGGPKWATTNVGATTPEENGNYYMFGSSTTASYCDWSYCPYAGSNINTNPYTKYGTARDGKVVLEAADDAAQQNWGCGWRTPTKAEMDALVSKCTMKYSYNDMTKVGGYTFTSKEAGNTNSIFLPLAGYQNGSSVYNCSNNKYWGRYMTSSFNMSATDKKTDAYMLYFYPKSNSPTTEEYKPKTSTAIRYWGISVRPVCD